MARWNATGSVRDVTGSSRERMKRMNCECGETIGAAKCGEGWCCDCNNAISLTFAELAMHGCEHTNYCKAHRQPVHYDDHCKDWISDK